MAIALAILSIEYKSFSVIFVLEESTMATSNGHSSLTKQDSKAPAVVQVNSLSEDDQLVNPADHDGKSAFILSLLSTCSTSID